MPGISITVTLSFTCIVTRESLQSVLCFFFVFLFLHVFLFVGFVFILHQHLHLLEISVHQA